MSSKILFRLHKTDFIENCKKRNVTFTVILVIIPKKKKSLALSQKYIFSDFITVYDRFFLGEHQKRASFKYPLSGNQMVGPKMYLFLVFVANLFKSNRMTTLFLVAYFGFTRSFCSCDESSLLAR